MQTAAPPADPGIVPLPEYGQALIVDEVTGDYVPALNTDPCSPNFGLPFNVEAADPITKAVVDNYGQDVDGLQTLILRPGYYPGGVTLNGNKLKLLPGVYAFGGGNDNGDNSGLVVTTGSTFDAQAGVMIYVTASNTATPYWGQIQLTGGDIMIHESYDPENPEAVFYGDQGYDLSAPDFKYVALYQDRDNPEEIRINGNTGLDLRGSLYFPTAHVVLSGTGIDAGTQFICGSLETVGTTEVTINYDGRFWAPGFRSILVE
jgi:hypothetical protein